MSRPKVGAIGALILVAFILNTVSVFTDNWINVTVTALGRSSSTGTGIVPYHSGLATWFEAGSWMMFISFGLFFPLALVYLHAGWKVHHHGCCHSIRHSFNGISLLAALITVLEAVAFILFACNVPHSGGNSYLSANEQIGSSAYLALTSAIFMVIVMALAGHVSRHHCH